VWSAVRDLVGAGTTVLLTTQYLEEADQLADRISMLKEGRVVAEGTPDELKAELGADWLDLELSDPATSRECSRWYAGWPTARSGREPAGRIPVKDRTRALVEVATSLNEAKIEPEDITLRRPTLDESSCT